MKPGIGRRVFDDKASGRQRLRARGLADKQPSLSLRHSLPEGGEKAEETRGAAVQRSISSKHFRISDKIVTFALEKI